MKRLVSMALLVAAMLSAGLSASAKGRKADVVMKKKGDFRKEIRFQGNCPRSAQMRHFQGPCRFDKRKDFRFSDCRRDVRFRTERFEVRRSDPRFGDRRFDKRFDKRRHGKKVRRF